MKQIAIIIVGSLAASLLPLHAGAQLAPGQVEIALHERVSASHGTVTLGEVASVRTTDLQAIRQLVDLPLGVAPQLGTQVALQREALARWIRMRTGIVPERIVWTGAAQAQVASAEQSLPSVRVEAAARGELESWLAARTTRFTLERTNAGPALQLPAGAVTMQARNLSADANPTSRMLVWVDVAVDGAYVRTVPVSFIVEAYREAWVAGSSATAGAPLDTRSLRTREVAVTEQPLALVPAAKAAELRATHSLRQGEPLTVANTRHLPAVRRGDLVALELRAGGLQLQSRAEALQEGDPGQLVQVRIAGASAAVQARVVAAGKVEVMP